MDFKIVSNILIILAIVPSLVGQLSGVQENADHTAGSINFKAPEMDDEDRLSPHMPEALKCDGCKIIAYQVHVHLKIV